MDESSRHGQQIAHRDAGRQAMRGGVVLAQALRAREQDLQRLRLDRDVLVLVVGEDVHEVLAEAARIVARDGEIGDAGKQFLDLPGRRAVRRPHARQIRLPIRSRRRSREVRLPVLGPGNARGRIVEPLRVGGGQGSGTEDGYRRESKRHQILQV